LPSSVSRDLGPGRAGCERYRRLRPARPARPYPVALRSPGIPRRPPRIDMPTGACCRRSRQPRSLRRRRSRRSRPAQPPPRPTARQRSALEALVGLAGQPVPATGGGKPVDRPGQAGPGQA